MQPDARVAYLDHAASTPVRPEARAAMESVADVAAANASGAHRAARRARAAVEDARDALADVLGVAPRDVVFTSGGTEADNLAILGRHRAVGGRVLCSAIEHPAVLAAVDEVDGKVVPVDRRGVVDLERLEGALDADVTLVSVMTVNNEVGSIQPVDRVAEAVRRRAPAAAVHTDAVQALTWLDLRDVSPHVDLMSVSGHKFGGPQGVGACVVRAGTALAARAVGGGQEQERRSGTLPVALVVGMAAAAVAADAARPATGARLAALRDRLVDGCTAVDGVRPTASDADGAGDHLVAGFAHLCVDGVDSEALLFLLDDAGVCASAASACASGAQQSSHVLAAMGVDGGAETGAVRFTLGHTTDDADVDRAVGAFVAAVDRLRRYPR